MVWNSYYGAQLGLPTSDHETLAHSTLTRSPAVFPHATVGG
jgi:hypothetical protein